jgi:hypothetical protein
MTASFRLGFLPFTQDDVLEAAEGLLLGDAGVGDAVEMLVEERLLLLRGEVAPVRDAAVVVVRDEIVEIFLQVRPGAGNAVDLPLADQFRERNAELRRAHRPGHREKHPPPGIEQIPPSLRRLDHRRGVEMPVMMLEKLADRAVHGRSQLSK